MSYSTISNANNGSITFVPNGVVSLFRTSFPRAGSNELVQAIASGSQTEIVSYSVGSSTLAIALCCFFVVWAVLVGTMHCKPHLGFISGAPMKATSSGSSNSSRSLCTLPRTVRAIFALSNASVLVALVLLLSLGFPYVQESSTVLQSSFHQLDDTATKGLDIMDQVESLGYNITSTPLANMNFTDLCPNGDLAPTLGNTLDLANATTLIKKVNASLQADLPKYQRGLQATQHYSSLGASALATFLKIPLKVLYWLPLTLLCTTFLIGVALASMDRSPSPFQSVQSNILLPIFFIGIVVSTALAAAISVYGAAAADFCSGTAATASGTTVTDSPLGTLLQIMQQQGYTPTDTEYQSLLYYGTECSGTDPLQQYFQYQGVLDDTLGQTQQLLDAVASYALGIQSLSLLCCGNINCLKPAITDMKRFVSSLETLSALTTQAEALLDCPTSISPLYQSTLNEGICDLSMFATAWTLGTLLIVSMFGMVVFTLRSAIFTLNRNKSPSDDEEDDSDEGYSGNKGFRQSPTAYDDDEDDDEHPVMTKRSWVEMQKSRDISMFPTEKYISHIENQNNPYASDVARKSTNKPRSWETVMSDVESRASQSDAAPPILKPLA